MPRKDGIAASLKARIDHLLQSSMQPFRNGALAESLDHPRYITAVLREPASDDRCIRRAHAPPGRCVRTAWPAPARSPRPATPPALH
ncbi:hypothetical protein F6Y24_04755 [Xanthomonas arboricola pv. pruni]|nr:hypothetical protein F6Y24_04755 [Xanthomonas arboricola pv. pruni]RST69279.1 hypothetical protein EJK96_12575 [Xanthomonas arboricola pv. pruni]RST76751.1 hypothetical protein EJL05_16175 [Xanthomonas arboricola pv. pruni]